MRADFFKALFLLVIVTSQSQSISETEVWKYFVTKYSNDSGRNYLTVSEISSLVQQNQNFSHKTLGDGKCNCPQVSTPPQPLIIKSSDCNLPFYPESQIFNLTSACPHILYLIDNPICSSSFHTSGATQSGRHATKQWKVRETEGVDTPSKPTPAEVWGYGILFVTLISFSSLAGVSVMPFMGKKLYKNILTVLIGLAVGSLTGSSVFHLIPQAYGLLDKSSSHNYLYTSLVICGGIWMFFMVERFLKIIMEHKERKDEQWKRAKKSSIYSSTPETSTISMLVENGLDKNGSDEQRDRGDRLNSSYCSPTSTGIIYECQEQAIKASFGHQEKPKCNGGHEKLVKFEQGKDSVIATVAWMIIFGDGLHNFIDGLSIGAAFNESILTGVSISVAVLCEELPHELGDFAVLLNAGMSIRQALIYNFLSACTCYVGLAIGIFLGEVEASMYIFGLAGGMFLYISLVDMVPEMNEVAEESSKISVLAGLKVLVLQNVGMFIGITALFALAKYQENIQF